MGAVEVGGLILGLLSIVLAVGAIWLSWVFYREGLATQRSLEAVLANLSNVAVEIRERSAATGAEVQDLRTGAFDLVKTSLSKLLDERQGNEGLESAREDQLRAAIGQHFVELRDDLLTSLDSPAGQRNRSVAVNDAVSKAVSDSVDSVIKAQQQAVRDRIDSALKAKSPLPLGLLVADLVFDYPMSMITDEVTALVQEGRVAVDGPRLHADALLTGVS